MFFRQALPDKGFLQNIQLARQRCTTEPEPDFKNLIIRLLLRIRIVIFYFFPDQDPNLILDDKLITNDYNKLLVVYWVYMLFVYNANTGFGFGIGFCSLNFLGFGVGFGF